MLKLPKRKIELVPYDNNYKAMFISEKSKIKDLLPIDVEVEHVGSTAIVGIRSKPIIDILLIVPESFPFEAVTNDLRKIGYFFIPELVDYRPNRRVYWKGSDDVHKYHIHCCKSDSQDIMKLINFRDRVNKSDELKMEYEKIKENLIKESDSDVSKYAMGKDNFIDFVLGS
ncbi:GrpB family protein [Vibrio harveyi]|uniref:GrpB family protein n=1 Tax=Vibrio harveyi TaxID=669 RepID=UPI0006486B6C|nr:GrpB family protein [Vibrio harveyi]